MICASWYDPPWQYAQVFAGSCTGEFRKEFIGAINGGVKDAEAEADADAL